MSSVAASLVEPGALLGQCHQPCWQRVSPPEIATLFYCRGAGLVRGIYVAGNSTRSLVSKNF